MSVQGIDNRAFPSEDRAGWKPFALTEHPPTLDKSKSSTTIVKALLVTLVLAVAAIAGLVVSLVVMQIQVGKQQTAGPNNDGGFSPTIRDDTHNVCLSKECVAAAARITYNLDTTVHPCDNFYKFACGGWMKKKVIPDDRSSISTFQELDDVVLIILKSLLEEEASNTDLNSINEAKDLYASCLNTELLDERGDQHFKDWLRSEFGGWPLTALDWDESNFDLVGTLIQATRYAAGSVVDIWVGTDQRDSSSRILKIDQPYFGMPGQKYYLTPRNDSMLMAYEHFIYNVASALGLVSPATARQDVQDIVDLEIELAKISVPAEERRDSNALYNPMTLQEVDGNYSQGLFNWTRFITSLTSFQEIGISDVTEDEIIINYSPDYFRNYTQVLASTSTRTLANYMIWRVVNSYINALDSRYRNLRQEYYKVLYGVSTPPARYKSCAGLANAIMGEAVGRLFVRTYFDSSAKQLALDMIRGLSNAFNELVDEQDWMDTQTKKVAKEKNAHIRPQIGFHDAILNDTYLEHRYSNLSFGNDTYFENGLTYNKVYFESMMRTLRQPVDKDEWFASPPTVNAYYSPQRNVIVFPAGILQPPFFSQNFPKSLNFGGIGVVIGHEITHGFDDQGRQYDKDGNLKQWWSDSVIAKFQQKAQCIVDQYSNYLMEEAGLNVNGINTQGENIADNGGLKQSYRAYTNWKKTQKKEEDALPGLNYTHDQLFFISYAQIWCTRMRKESVIARIRTGVHTPGPYRAIGATQNSPEFSEAFKCPRTSYMNPATKCNVW